MNKMWDLGFGPKKKGRVKPTSSEWNEKWDKQKGLCYNCKQRLSPTTTEYHHKDGDPSNWKLSNIALVCVKCHKEETNRQRIKRTHKKRRQKEAKERDPLGLGGLYSQKPRQQLLLPKYKPIKIEGVLGGGFGLAGKKKRRKKGPFDLY